MLFRSQPEPQRFRDFEHRDLAIHPGLLLRPLRRPKREACARGQVGGKGFEKPQSQGGKGFEKLSREGSLGFENRQKYRCRRHREWESPVPGSLTRKYEDTTAVYAVKKICGYRKHDGTRGFVLPHARHHVLELLIDVLGSMLFVRRVPT